MLCRIVVVVVVVDDVAVVLFLEAKPRESCRASGDRDATYREDRLPWNRYTAAYDAAVSYAEADEAGEEEELRRGRDCS